MWCPRCKEKDTKVIDSRVAGEHACIRRRRACIACEYRFTTREYIEVRYPRVIKRGGGRCQFDPAKLRSGVSRALEKRPMTSEQFEQLISSILDKICQISDDEITSQAIGEFILSSLKEADEVAYVRFASVYRSFQDLAEFRDAIESLEAEPAEGDPP